MGYVNMIFALLRFCLHMSKVDKGIDITWNSRVVIKSNCEEYKRNRVEKDIYLKRGDKNQFNFRNNIYENRNAIDIAPINSKICHRLFLWVSYMKNYFTSNKNELQLFPVNKCCKEGFVTNKCANHDAVKFRGLYNVFKVDLNKIMWWHSNKLR
ncbi:hypothetical protein COBT_004247, partial [Conglomerata obtusa]